MAAAASSVVADSTIWLTCNLVILVQFWHSLCIRRINCIRLHLVLTHAIISQIALVSARQLILLRFALVCLYVCPLRLGMLRNLLCAVVRWRYGTRTWPHYCCHVSTVRQVWWIDLWAYFDTSQWWIIGPTDDEDDRVYSPSRNDALSILESVCSALGLSSTLEHSAPCSAPRLTGCACARHHCAYVNFSYYLRS